MCCSVGVSASPPLRRVMRGKVGQAWQRRCGRRKARRRERLGIRAGADISVRYRSRHPACCACPFPPMPIEIAGDSSENEAMDVGASVLVPAPAPPPRRPQAERPLLAQGALRVFIVLASIPRPLGLRLPEPADEHRPGRRRHLVHRRRCVGARLALRVCGHSADRRCLRDYAPHSLSRSRRPWLHSECHRGGMRTRSPTSRRHGSQCHLQQTHSNALHQQPPSFVAHQLCSRFRRSTSPHGVRLSA